MKTLKTLAKEAETRTVARVEAESPSIRDTPQRRLTVYRSELTALAAEHHLNVLDAEIDDLAAEFAFGRPAEPGAERQASPAEPEDPEAPEIPQEAPVSDEK